MADGDARIDYSKFTSSLQRLEEQHQHLLHDVNGYPSWIVDGMRESVIQRFEVCIDTCWKTLRRHLGEVLELNDVPTSPVEVLKLGSTNSLLGEELPDWLEYWSTRNDTSHDYSEKKADACLAIVGPYIRDAIALLERLIGKPWRSMT